MIKSPFHKIYTKLENITRATCTVKCKEAGVDEMASVDARPAQVIRIQNDQVTLQVFTGTQGLGNNAEVIFSGKAPTLNLSQDLLGRFFNAYGEPIDHGPKVYGEETEIGGPPVNPVKRMLPYDRIHTGLAGIDLNNALVAGQKIPFFADPDQPYNEVLTLIAQRADTDVIIIGGMGLPYDDYLYFKHTFEQSNAIEKLIGFINTTQDSAIERLLIPDLCLTAAEYFAINQNKKVLVLLSDMTLYAESLAIVSNRMDQIPSKDSMPGTLYSDLARLYEKAVQLPDGGSVTILSVTTLSGGDITHAIPDNTGYITEGQLYLKHDSHISKTIIDPFRSLSRLKQLIMNKKTREDHSQVMNAAIRLYADAANAKTKQENGFDLSEYDQRCIDFSIAYAQDILSIQVNLQMNQALDRLWELFATYFKPEEVQIKQNLVEQYGMWRTES